MSAQELMAGKQWVERRFFEIAREFGVLRALTQEDRWRAIDLPMMSHRHRVAYYIELAGHLKRGAVTFPNADLEVAGAGELATQERLSRHIRDVLVSLGNGERSDGMLPTVTGRL